MAVPMLTAQSLWRLLFNSHKVPGRKKDSHFDTLFKGSKFFSQSDCPDYRKVQFVPNRYIVIKNKVFLTIIFGVFLSVGYNNCANDKGVLDGSLSIDNSSESIDPPVVEEPPVVVVPPPPPPVVPPPPPANTPAYVTRVFAIANGAIIETSGPVQAMRYFYDSSNGWINISGPFTSPFNFNFVWPEPSTTFTCFQVMGTDGVWRGPNNPAAPNDLQQCNSVPST